MQKHAFLLYLKKFGIQIISWAATLGIFLLLGGLTGMKPQIWHYAVLLSLTLLILSLFIQYLAERRRMEQMQEYRMRLPEIPEELSSPASPSDAEEQEIIRMLQTELKDRTTQYEKHQSDMLEYYSMWVHQIKTPISALNLLIQGSGSPLQGEMDLELRRIQQYVEMVLSYQRLGSDQTDFLFQKTDLDRLIRACVKNQSVFFIRRHLSLDFQPTEKTITTDRKWLAFALGQILSNAVKYTKEGGRIRIRAEQGPAAVSSDANRINTPDHQSGFLLIIEDNGIGIRKEDLPRIFDRGFTGANGREHQKATGLGLYLTSEVLKRLGCEISAESQAGQGTRMIVRFPEEEKKLFA